MKKPHIFFFIVDQMQWQGLGKANPLMHTPHWDQLADEGVLFDHAFVSHPQCVPSRVSMQTGLYPHEAKVMMIYNFHGHSARLTQKDLTVGHVLRDAGYATSYFGKTHFGVPLKDLGYDVGDDYNAEDGLPDLNGDGSRPLNSLLDKHIVDAALNYLESADPNTPQFITVSLFQPHPPFEMVDAFEKHYPLNTTQLPESFYNDNLASKPAFIQERLQDREHSMLSEDYMLEETRRYRSMMSSADHQFGRLRQQLEDKGFWDNTVTLMTSDHGDMMGAHQLRLKGTLPYEELFHVPLIYHNPQRSMQRKVVDDLVVNTAIPGTLIESAGLPIPPSFKGGSLLPTLEAASHPEDEMIFLEHYGAYWGLHPFYMARTRDWKYATYYGPDKDEELYHLKEDPHELNNLAQDTAFDDIKKRLKKAADDWWQSTGGRDFDYYESEEFKNRYAKA